MKTARHIIFMISLIVGVAYWSVYFHDKNVVNQCNKYGYTDSMAYGGRLSCLETNEN